jgi:hypothetical protein
MTLAEGFDRLQRETAGCRALVFGDLDTRTVLRSAAVPGFRQEDHDALLAEAAECLGAGGARVMAEAGLCQGLEAGDAARPLEALRLLPGEARLYRRLSLGSTEVICARLAANGDLDGFDAALAELIDAHA